MTDRVGQQFGQHRLTGFLGRGSFGEVYLGEHIHKGTPAAVKVLQARLTPEDLKEFINEASTMFRLHHPNIVQLLDFGIGPDNTAFLTMAYAPGGTLRQRHPRGTQLSLELVVSYASQIAAALQHAHDERLIHRDVKPENILLGPNNEVWLSDFGIVSVVHSSRSFNTEQPGGTVPYMAPEQIQGKPRPASDQYALGIMAYEWLCGERPFNGTTWEIISQHTSTPPPSLCGKAPTISAEVEQVVLIALAKDPKQRFVSVSAFARALEQAAQPKPVHPLMGTTLLTYRGHSGDVTAVAWSPDGSRIASVSRDGTVQVWDVRNGENVFTYHGHSGAVWSATWLPDGRHIASADRETAQVWDAATGNTLYIYSGHSKLLVTALAWSPDGSRIAWGSRDGTVQVWDADSGAVLHHYGDSVSALKWSPNGKCIASTGGPKFYGPTFHSFRGINTTVEVWDATSGATLLTYDGHSELVGALAWSPDSKCIASTHLADMEIDHTVQVWDATSGVTLLTYSGHSFGVSLLAWSPDGRRITLGKYDHQGTDHTVQVRDATSGTTLLTYGGHADRVSALAWSPDGGYIASGSQDTTVQVWQAP